MLELRGRLEREDEADAIVALGGDERLDEAWEALTWWRGLHARPLTTVAANLRYHVDRSGARMNDRIEVTQRLKRLPTLIGKLARERGNVTQMHDIGGVRTVVPSLRHIYVLRRRLLKTWSIVKERDYISKPKDTGYRAMHLIVHRSGYPIEVQRRTLGQDIWANIVEDSTRELAQGFKFGEGNAKARDLFGAMAELIAAFDRDEVTYDDLRSGLRQLPEATIRGSDGP